jgi:glutamate formiminotransferase/glutamate formiminotransferase/formiminotetrahydrofolate cyclodeaminase
MMQPILLAVPNVSEGRDEQTIAAIASAFTGNGMAGVRVLDVHSDADHHRSVFTIAGRPGALVDALLRGARVALERIDVVSRAPRGSADAGQHPHVGALDVAPIVYLRPRDRGAACAAALVLGDRLGEELQLPVFLYGELSGSDRGSARTRSQMRRGGVAGLAARLAAGEDGLTPDFGPARMHPRAGATLLAARPPLVAFNLQLAAPATVIEARAIAEQIREGGSSGLPGVRALGLTLDGDVAQVSMNVEQPLDLPLARVVDAVRVHAEIASAELVGLAPAAAFDGFPDDVPMPGFDPQRHVIENALGC